MVAKVTSWMKNAAGAYPHWSKADQQQNSVAETLHVLRQAAERIEHQAPNLYKLLDEVRVLPLPASSTRTQVQQEACRCRRLWSNYSYDLR